MFGWEFPPHNSGGLGTACFGLTRSLSQVGADVVFVLPKELGIDSEHVKMRFAGKAEEFISKVKFSELDVFLNPYITSDQYDRQVSQKYSGGNFPYAMNLYQEVLRYAQLAKKIAKEEKYDLIHAHDWLSFPAAMEAKKIGKKKLIVHVHATEYDRTGGNGVNPMIHAIETKGLQQADKIIAVSSYTKEIISDKYKINPKKIEVVHNGIDRDYFHKFDQFNQNFQPFKKAGFKIVTFVGRITIQKGPGFFVQAAKKVLDYNDKVIFIVAGSGDMENEMMRQAAELGISDRVLFAGFLRDQELQSVYRSADLFVMPSVSEPFGLTALESMYNHTPILISKQSGVSETVRCALKVDFWDIDEMTNKILAVLQYNTLGNYLAYHARKEVEKINWRQAAKKCLDIYRTLMLEID